MSRRAPVGPMSLRSEIGASGVLMAFGVATILFIVVGAMQLDTDNTIQFNHKLNSTAEMRRANRSALETMSQMLLSGGIDVPLPGDRNYGGKNTAQRQNQDAKN